jgi:nucleotide-binding universal stress UspA family protein
MLALSNIPRLSIKKIVVATDFTTASRAALQSAIAIATHYGSKVILVHGVQTAPRNGPQKVTSYEQLHDLSDAEWKLATEARKCADLQCE